MAAVNQPETRAATVAGEKLGQLFLLRVRFEKIARQFQKPAQCQLSEVGLFIKALDGLTFGAMSVSTGTTANNYQQLSAHWGAYADLGYHVFYPLENCAGGTCTYDLSGGTMSFVVSTTY